MNSVVDYVAKCLNPVHEETMNRIDYLLFIVLNSVLMVLLRTWLAMPEQPTRQEFLAVFSRGWFPLLLLWWMWFCATMNRAADAGVTRAGFAKVYFVAPILAIFLFATIPSVLTLLIVLAVTILPTVFLFFWPSRYA